MKFRTLAFLILLCGIAGILFVMTQRSREPSVPRATDYGATLPEQTQEPVVPPAEEPVDPTAQEGGPPGTLSSAVGQTGTSTSQPAPSGRPAPQPATSPLPTTANPSPPTLAQDQATPRDPDIVSYPPVLRESATNNFVRAIDRLGITRSDSERYLALSEAAKLAFVFGETEDALKYASELLSLDQRFQGEPWRDGTAVHDGNLVLGQIALEEGQVEEAKRYLQEAGKSTGSPVLGTFGPNMSLARDLLQKGETQAVLEYFDLCARFWQMGAEKLAEWTADVDAGRMPDFGGNLYY